MRNINLLLLLCALFSFCPLLQAAPDDNHWAPTFGGPGTTNTVYALAVRGNDIYASGFWSAGPISTNNWIEHWNGSKWSALPGIFTGSMPIFDSLFIGNDLYVCGFFSQLDGQPARGIARWNGQNWTVIGDVLGLALALATDGTNLYMGGVFTNVSGVSVTNIAKWDGQVWSSLGSGLGSGSNGLDSFVKALLWKDGTLYAGGQFTNAGGTIVRHLAQWNGSGWADVAGSMDGPVYALAGGSGQALYAGGNFASAGSAAARGIARWDGASWLALGSGLIGNVSGPATFAGPVYAIGVLGTNVLAGGSFTNAGGIRALRIAHWNGLTWSAIGNMNGEVQAIRVSGTNFFIGGAFSQADDLIVNHLTRWDGTTFHPIGEIGRSEGSTFPGLRALASGNGHVYAGGIFTGIGRIRASRIAAWDGTNWNAMAGGVRGTNDGTGTAVNAVAVSSTGDVYIGGAFTNAGGVPAFGVARWNGSAWSPLGAGIPGTVSAIAVRGTEVFVGGTFTLNTPGGTAFNLARWNGSAWSSLPGGTFLGNINNFTVSALAFQGSDLVVGGNFVAGPIGGPTSTNIVKHNGSDWVPLGGGVNSNVQALVVVGTDIYAGGRFSRAGGLTVSRIAKWNGSSWSDVGGGVTGSGNFSVSALAAIGSDIYAAGNFTAAGGVMVNRIAKWNGASWSALGSGVARSLGNPTVLALASLGQDLYAGGNFEYAGTRPSYYIARWNESIDFDLVPSLHLSNPLRLPDGRFRFSLISSGVPSYVVEASANLTNWVSIQTNTTSSTIIEDAGAVGSSQRFYRARGQ